MEKNKKIIAAGLVSVIIAGLTLVRFLVAESTEKNKQSFSERTDAQRSIALKKVETWATHPTPAGKERIRFRLEVDKSGAIVSAVAQILAENETSSWYQESFADVFPSALVGKKLSELSAIDRIGSSSLTTEAFNASIDELQAQL